MSICDVGDDDEVDYKALVHVLTHGKSDNESEWEGWFGYFKINILSLL